MPDLAPLTPLGGTALRVDKIGSISIAESDDWALASLAARKGHESEVVAQARKLIGAELPGPGHVVASGDWRAFWMSPQSWMLAAPFSGHEMIAAEVKAAVGDAGSVTEQTDAWARFDVTVPDSDLVATLLERLCNIDPRRAGPGTATRSVIEHLGVYVIRFDETGVSVLGPRSSATDLHHALTTAAHAL